MAKKIEINGINYQSFDEIPPDVRLEIQGMLSKFADKNLNGIPDIFEDNEMGHFVLSSDSRIIINNKEYASIEELPPFARKAFEKVIDLTDQERYGMPDLGPVTDFKEAVDDHPEWQTDMSPLIRTSTSEPVQESVSTSSSFITALIIIAFLVILIFIFLILFVR